MRRSSCIRFMNGAAKAMYQRERRTTKRELTACPLVEPRIPAARAAAARQCFDLKQDGCGRTVPHVTHTVTSTANAPTGRLRRGLLNLRDRNKVMPLLAACHALAQPDELWVEAGDLGFALRRRGITPKTLDLLIATYALTHSVPILSTDKDFALMRKAGIPLQLTLD
jgi:hypothetical protein